MSQANAANTFEFKAEMKQLLNLIVHSLYTHPEVFLRELISNSSDALNKARFKKISGADLLDADVPLEIQIDIDSKKQTFSIEDTGIGMTKDELISNIGTVAKSGTLEFLQQLKEAKESTGQRAVVASDSPSHGKRPDRAVRGGVLFGVYGGGGGLH